MQIFLWVHIIAPIMCAAGGESGGELCIYMKRRKNNI